MSNNGQSFSFWSVGMGGAKREWMEFQEKVDQARSLCVEVGAIEVCPVHDGEYSDTLEWLDMEELTAHIMDALPYAIQSFKDRDEMKECITQAMQEAGEECGACASNRDS